jgi:bis(5'-nucleosyl)-tetraphosphatase (symmetrical)
MALYLVGDIQGCYAELDRLLTRVAFNPRDDQLWAVGDLVARGPDSLRVLQLFQQLGPAAATVLGNHDLHLLSLLSGVKQPKKSDRLDTIMALPAQQREDIIDWLVHCPLLLQQQQLLVTHAGIYPWWSVSEAINYAAEVSASLQDAWRQQRLSSWLTAMYGNHPEQWHPHLQDEQRLRFIINAFTRMRFCYADGRLDLTAKQAPSASTVSAGLIPWYQLWQANEPCLVFGHWAALAGATGRADVVGLDSGCVWGQHLTLWRWPDGQCWQQPALS